VIAADIQCHNARPFDYATYVFKEIDSGLMVIKNNSPILHFEHYFLLMNMILYYGQEIVMWPEELGIKQLDKKGQPLPVQLWTSVWDNRFAHSNYVYFEKYFVKILYRFFNHRCDYSLSNEIKRFLRPKDFNGPPTMTHNWGDWYCLLDSTMIKVYGFEGTPFLLPKTVPDRIAYLEIARQMDYSNVMNLNAYDK